MLGIIKGYFNNLQTRHESEMETIQVGDTVGTNLEGVSVLFIGLALQTLLIVLINLGLRDWIISGVVGIVLFSIIIYLLY